MDRWLIKRRGLRAKMTAWVLLPTAAILVAVGAVAFGASQRVTEDLVLQRNQDGAKLLAGQLSAELEGYERSLGSVASMAAEEPLHRMQVILDREWPGGQLFLFDAGVVVLDRTGTVVASVPDAAHLYGERFSELVAEGRTPRPENLLVSDILSDTVVGLDVIAYSRPLVDTTGEAKGTVVGLFHAERGATRTSSFYRRIWELYIGRQGTAYLVDSHGRVIFHTDTFLIGESFSGLAAVQGALAGRTGALRTEDVEGEDVVAGYAPVPRTSWGLVTEERWSEVTRAIRPYNRFLLGLLMLGVVVPVAVVAFGVRRITQPIGELTKAAQEIASGNFSQRIDVHTGDELETLAQQFNAMAARLQASYADLERRVADRTRELATLNAVATVVSRSLELEEVMQAALQKTLETMEMEAGVAFRLDPPDRLSLIAHQGLSETFVERVRHISLQESIAFRAVSKGAPAVRSVEGYPEGWLKHLLQREGIGTVVGVPLIARDEVLGVLNLAARRQLIITAEERSLLASVGRQAGLAVENARLYERAEAAAAAAERNRLAGELHDAVSQTLFSASMIADVLPRLWERDPEEARRRLEDIRRLTRGAMAEMRTLLWELRPSALLEAGLDELLGQLSKIAAGRASLKVALDAQPIFSPPDDVKVALYRIAQEALNNVVKHAEASHVAVSIHASQGGLEMHILDDGRGFAPEDVPGGHLGLTIMHERAQSIGAELSVASELGVGTDVRVVWREAKGDGDDPTHSGDAGRRPSDGA